MNTLTTDVRPAKIERAHTKISRRALIGGASIAAAALVTPASAVPTSDSDFPPEWHALIATYRRIQARALAASDVHTAAEEAYFAQRKPEPARTPRRSQITEDMTIAQIRTMSAELIKDNDEGWRAWRADTDAAHARIVDPANDAWTAILREESAAMQAIQAYPATSPAMVVEKLRLLAEYHPNDVGGDPHDLTGIIADVRRLTGREG